jgi:hypothetical protein
MVDGWSSRCLVNLTRYLKEINHVKSGGLIPMSKIVLMMVASLALSFLSPAAEQAAALTTTHTTQDDNSCCRRP